jgi:hypothetical protein
MSVNDIEKDIDTILQEYLSPDKKYADTRGEVFTPPNLIKEMLFGINSRIFMSMKENIPSIFTSDYLRVLCNPIDKDISTRIGGIEYSTWYSQNSSFLDSASGIGNFPIIVFFCLYATLKNTIPDNNKRSKHIIERMIYMIEIDKENVKICKDIFNKINPSAKVNILCKNTLEVTKDDIMTAFGKQKFTVIMGNPPYQSGGVKSKGVTTKDYKTIWPYWIANRPGSKYPGAFELLEDNGYLCYIHPSSWLHTNDVHDMHTVILSKKILFLRIFSNSQANKIFSSGGAVRVAYYVMKNIPVKSNTITVIDVENNIDNIKQTLGTIYQSYNSVLQKVYSKINTIGETNYIKSEGKLKTVESNKKIYSNICSHKEGGVLVCKTDTKFKHYDTPKIIFKGSSKLYHFDDFTGKYGVFGNWGYYILDTNISNLKRFSKFCDTKLAKLVMIATKEDQDFIEPKYLPDIREIPSKVKINDTSLCSYFDINTNMFNNFIEYTTNQNILNIADSCGSCTKSNFGKTRKATKKASTKTRKRERKC